MKLFKEKTYDHCIITGRKNYESIPEKFRPLPGRVNIVVTRNKEYLAHGAIIVSDMDSALMEARRLNEEEVFIIGGGEIYKQTIHLADELWITRVHKDFDGDVVFPTIDKSVWNEEEVWKFTKDDKHNYDFTLYHYTRKTK